MDGTLLREIFENLKPVEQLKNYSNIIMSNIFKSYIDFQN